MGAVTDIFFAPKPPRWQRYVATGDSFTEGLSDSPEHPEQFRGWADLLAQSLTARRREARLPALEYANLAIRGRLLAPILAEQVPAALELNPDLISIGGGGNDLLRPGGDPDRLGAHLDRVVRGVRARGIDVLLTTGMDTRQAGPLLTVMRPKVAVLNAHVWSIARNYGAYVLDIWGLRALQHRRMWAQDRVHMSTQGHQRVQQAALVALGLEPDDAEWAAAVPPDPKQPRTVQLREDASWIKRDVYPWATRRFRRRSSGDTRRPKRPAPAPLEDGEGPSRD